MKKMTVVMMKTAMKMMFSRTKSKGPSAKRLNSYKESVLSKSMPKKLILRPLNESSGLSIALARLHVG